MIITIINNNNNRNNNNSNNNYSNSMKIMITKMRVILKVTIVTMIILPVLL